MTPDAFRALTARLGAVVERPILDTIEFRVGNRTFATLGWPAAGWAIVRLSIADQAKAVGRTRGVHAEPGPRGERGVTLVRLRGVDDVELAAILTDAWREAYRHHGAASLAAGDERPTPPMLTPG